MDAAKRVGTGSRDLAGEKALPSRSAESVVTTNTGGRVYHETLNEEATKVGFSLRDVASMRPSPGAGWLYFIQSVAGGPVKIGRSSKPRTRLGELQMGNPDTLRIVLASEGVGDLEDWFHHQLRLDRVGGEWFDEFAVADLLEKMGVPAYLLAQLRRDDR